MKTNILNTLLIVIIGTIVVVGSVSAATTISNDIVTGGVLTVSGTATSTFVGAVGIGTTTPNSLLGVYELIDFNNIDFNTKIGYQAGKYVVTGATWNTFVGYQSGLSSSTASTNAASFDTALGFKTLYSNTTGASNTAIGYSSLTANTSGTRNTGVGSNALAGNTTGSQNTAMGRGSMVLNTTGSSNTAIGHQSMNFTTTGSFNVGLGNDSNQRTSSGNFNTAIGAEALAFNTVGNNNTILGYSAGFNLTTASSSIIIGANVNAASTTLDGQLNIGNLIYGTGLYNGNSLSSTPVSGGNVGIGTTSPSSALAVEGTTTIHGNLSVSGTINRVKVYRALLTQSGTAAPVATVLENSLGSTIVWSRVAPGIYNGVLAGVFAGGSTKVFILTPGIPQNSGNIDEVPDYRVVANQLDADTLRVSTGLPGVSASDDVLQDHAVQILIYP